MRTMRAVRLHEDGLRIEQLPVPEPDAGEALVRVHAAALTRDELTWPVDRLPATPSYELSGVVAGVAGDVRGVAEADEVFALTPFDRDGVAAEYAVVPAAVLARRPRTLSHAECAALTLAGLSAWQGLFDHGALREDERVRVLGERGGVGHLAVQLAGGRLAAPGEPCDLVFDTIGGDPLAAAVGSARRVVSVAEEAEGITYFVVEPNRSQLLELARLAEADQLSPRSIRSSRSWKQAQPSAVSPSAARAARSSFRSLPIEEEEVAMWVTEHSVETTAPPEAIWRQWSDVDRWHEWNGDIERIELDGPFAVGSRITMVPVGDEPVELRIAEAVEPELFVDEADFGEIVVRTIHRVEQLDEERTRVTYRMEITGPAADTVGPQVGPEISGDFPQVLAALVERAES